MGEPVCVDCWRRDNLTFAQRLDPAFVTPGPAHRCATHRAFLEDLHKGPEHTPRAA
ncbi:MULTISPECIES: hypothetical protein [Nocardia]|uniref:hypothetical protein n=1 Tax=Nocardia TaxID=1817 RepID=UPI00163D8272|nr:MULTISPECIES: hypothetical protein [Nocardia]MBF6181662.1 hypothetical protein [Nocardia otitidiscaviarum]MCP9618922.1 hypothetical protein [Nocardia otitidiscaviarum]